MTPQTHQGCDSPSMTQGLLPLSDALQRLRDTLTPIAGFERLALREALGRVVAETVTSPINVPGHVNSAMDGYAINSCDIPSEGSTKLEVVGTAFAGTPYSGAVNPGECVRIMTGAVVPDGADTVIMQEHVERDGDTISFGDSVKARANVRYIGEDLKVGQTVLEPGKRITPADLGLLASLGVAEITVTRRLRVAFFSTGDELRSIGESLETGQIYDSNRYTLHGLLRSIGAELIDMGIIADDRQAIESAFKTASEVADVVLTSGGVSVGEADYVKETLDKMGEVQFWKIKMKPGKPLAFGKVGKAWFFGLPGNPVSTMATFYQVVQPSLKHLMGERQTEALLIKVPAAERLKKRPGRQDFQRGVLFRNESGELVVRATGGQGSHILRSMSEANCFIVLAADDGDTEAGEMVEVQPFEGLF